ncbi:hypothetical protein [Nocardiopsis lucentensis]|uniref:hypothetical protein n=1 Tax=Nocardiopsis lucentensis TaxID=53441 RepID=UPI0012687828|nr:hypothetical protein [Nocardiopsis lucentensis]
MAVNVVFPGEDDWPKRTSPALEGLHMHCGRELVERVRGLGIADLGPKSQLLPTKEGDRTKNQLRALFCESEEAAPVALYAITHLVPTLRYIGWI